MANTVPNNMKIGTALGFVGGVIALVAMAASWNADIDSMYLVGINMLVAVMFFAAAGTFTKYSPVCGNTVVVLSGLAGAVTSASSCWSSRSSSWPSPPAPTSPSGSTPTGSSETIPMRGLDPLPMVFIGSSGFSVERDFFGS